MADHKHITDAKSGNLIPYTVITSMTDIDTLPPCDVSLYMSEKEQAEKIIAECWSTEANE